VGVLGVVNTQWAGVARFVLKRITPHRHGLDASRQGSAWRRICDLPDCGHSIEEALRRGYTRSLMSGLDDPVLNQFGLRPAVVEGTKKTAPLTINPELDKLGLLNGVTTFNFHLHLPHFTLTTAETKSIRFLASQPVDLPGPHPFAAAGNREFNTCLGMPPDGKPGGHILPVDSSNFTTFFGGTESLARFWSNVAKM
jgi:hypothetical protein